MYVLLSITQDSCKAILSLNIFRGVTTNFFQASTKKQTHNQYWFTGLEGLLENLGMTMAGLTYVYAPDSDMRTCAVIRVIEHCCFTSVLDPFNGQTVNFILKPPNCNKNLC